MSNTLVSGIQWGDEGKGKIVDWLAEFHDVVVRYQGGNNAGHTLVIGGSTFKLSLLPSGMVRAGKLNVVGSGTVVDPWELVAEIKAISDRGIAVSPENLLIADNATLILPIHKELDSAREVRAGTAKIGTTGKGIGPAYEDKVGRRSIRVGDLENIASLDTVMGKLLDHHNALRRHFGMTDIDEASLRADLEEIAPKILPFAGPASRILHERQRQGSRILFEGAQGALLDIDHGTYPYVTSSSTLAASAATGAGTGPRSIGHVLGVAKAYCTRVGAGPFPTELFDEIGGLLSERGREIGTVTGRARRCGWFDAVLARQVCESSGVDGIALTKLDVLDGLEHVKICVAYEVDGKRIDRMPSSMSQQGRLVPVYESMPGWTETSSSANSVADLPNGALSYLKRLEQLVGVEIELLSVSPDRNGTIPLSPRF